jgi:BMFP domain-containing protein YqiC
MQEQPFFDDLGQRIRELMANSPARDFEKNLRALLASAFARLDLVTREEFDVQRTVLARTREKLALLEARLLALEKTAAQPLQESPGPSSNGELSA